MSHIIATFFYIGHLRPAPGSWGSLAALISGAAVINGAGLIGLCIGIFLACLLGYWATARETAGKSDHDPSEIVIDEVAGQWIALLPLAVGATHAGASLFALWPGWVAAFLLFRLFDIWKPSIIGWADRRSDAIGVMLDDCFAGLFAALGVIALAGLFHGLLS